jgi:hypothetical protein
MIKTTEQMDVSTLQLSLKPLREEIINHKMYSRIQTVQDVAIFMEHHVFAVWDFMSLLKSLQVKLTCTKIPWLPSDHALASRLINEIVLTEESDELPGGGYGSHFTLYRRAMIQCGADTSGIDSVVARATTGASLRESVTAQQPPMAARDFVYATCGLIESDSAVTIAALPKSSGSG